MILERVEVAVHEGREDEFERAMVRGRKILSQAAGCLSVKLERGVERPNRYLLLLEWNTLEDHLAFTTTEPFAEFRGLAGPFFCEKPAMEHFRSIT